MILITQIFKNWEIIKYGKFFKIFQGKLVGF